MQNVGLDHAQGEIKIAGRNINIFDISDTQMTSSLWQKAKTN